MAAPTIVGTPAVGGRIGFGTYTCTPPAGAAFYVAFVGTNSIPNLIPPPNWTLLTSNNGASTGSRWAIYTAPASASPGATWERGGTSSTGVQAVIVVGYDQAVTLATPVTAASATSPATMATGEGLALRLLTRLPSTNADPTYPTAATLGRNVSRQYQAAGNAVEVAVAHQSVSAAGAVATAAWSASTSGDITAFTVMAYGAAPPAYETVAGASTASLASPAARWVKGTMRPVWSDGDTWSAILPSSTGHRRYADIDSPSASAVVDSRQDARLTAVHYGGTTFVLRAHTSSSLFSSFDSAWSTIVNGASFPLAAADLDASPIALHRSPNGYLWAAVGESGAIKVTRSTDGGATWAAATTLVGSLTDTAVVAFGQAGSMVVLVANGNTGIGRWVRSIDQAAASIAAGSWATETLPALPSGVTSDDHLAVTSVPDGRVLAVAKTTDATTSGHPLIYLLARATDGTWTSSTIEPGPDVGGVRYTRPVLTVVGSNVEVMYGSIEDPKNLTIRTASLSDLTTWSTRTALFTGPDWSDSAVLPSSLDVRRHGATYPVLAQQRSDSTVVVAWRDAPAPVHDMDGAAAATSATAGAVGLVLPASGSVAVASGVAGSATRATPTTGGVAATSGASGAITAQHSIGGTVTSTSGVAGAVSSILTASGTVAAVSSAYGVLVGQADVTGTIVAASGGSGAVTAAHSPAGTIAVTSGVTGSATARHALAGTVDAVSGSAGAVVSESGSTTWPAVGTIATVSSAAGTVLARHAINGVASATTTIAGDLDARLTIAGTIAAATTVSGHATVSGQPDDVEPVVVRGPYGTHFDVDSPQGTTLTITGPRR